MLCSRNQPALRLQAVRRVGALENFDQPVDIRIITSRDDVEIKRANGSAVQNRRDPPTRMNSTPPPRNRRIAASRSAPGIQVSNRAYRIHVFLQHAQALDWRQ
jgi:hypothetical protein